VKSYKETDSTLIAQLLALGVTPEQLSPEHVTIEVKPPSQWAGIVSGALYILPVIFMAGVLWFIFRQAKVVIMRPCPSVNLGRVCLVANIPQSHFKMLPA